MRKIKAILCSLLSLCIIAVPLASSFAVLGAEDISSLESQLEELTKKSNEYQKTLDKTQSDINEKEKYSNALVGKIEVLGKKITVANQSIDKLNKDINQKQDEIDKGNADIESQLDALCERLKAIYKAGSASDLEIVLGAKDLSDFIDKIYLVKTLSGIDEELINEINEKLTIINEQKASLEEDKVKLDKEKQNLQADLDDLNGLLEENEELLQTLYDKSSDAKSKLEDVTNEASKLESEIAEYWEEYAKAQAAQANSGPVDVSDQIKQNEEHQQNANQSSQGGNSQNSQQGGQSSQQSSQTTPSGGSSSSGYTWPTPGCYILTSLWNEDRNTYNHGAIDIGCSMGTTVVAAASGTVTSTCTYCGHNWGKSYSCGCGGGFGNYVWMSHGNGKETIYGHLTSVVVSPGQYVTKGQVIGYSGTTGYSTGPHLHFECRYNGVKYNPMTEFPYF